jgi:hypothetical protein
VLCGGREEEATQPHNYSPHSPTEGLSSPASQKEAALSQLEGDGPQSLKFKKKELGPEVLTKMGLPSQMEEKGSSLS